MIKSVLVIGAHPDDETILTGGTLALLSSQGVRVHILCATRGEGGEVGEPPVCEQSELGVVREHELRCAAEKLGAASIRTLGYVDPVIGPDEELYSFEADFDTLAAQLRAAIRAVEAEVVITHGRDGEYGHPAHRLLHRATRAAVEGSAYKVLLYTFAAIVPGIEDRIWNKHDPAHLALDVRPWLDAKEAAALCHVTQHALFKRRSRAGTVREVLRTVEGFHRHIPVVEDGYPQDAFADLLLAAGAWLPSMPG
jgi:LmbE family N-acetylglucosaminyl deacetylase